MDLPSLTSTNVFHALARIDRTADIVEGYLVEHPTTGIGLDDEIANVASVLGPSLLKPLARALEDEDRTSVCIVAIGVLGWVPLHALAWDENGAARCLLDGFDVAYAPSSYVRQVCRDRARGRPRFQRLLAVGNPLPQTNPLPNSEHAAALVESVVPAEERVLLVGEAATKEAVMEALPSASHVHLACHGCAAGDVRAFDSALSLDNDRTVSAAEILGLDLSRARIVVASACETGVIPGYETADEALALSTVFLGAGAAGVVASLWSVDDYGTSLLMARFYEHLVPNPDNPAGALRAAQLWLRDLTVEEEAKYAARHPALERQCARRARARNDLNDLEAGEGNVDDRATQTAGFDAPTMWAAFIFSGA